MHVFFFSFQHKQLLNGVTASIKVEEAGLPDLKSLENLIKSAERMEIPLEDLKESYEKLEELKSRIYPVSGKSTFTPLSIVIP